MTINKRIFLNVVATYGRTLFGAACGIFSTRWVLMALGQEDFGLYGLIGSIVIFLSFFNIQFAGALSRFYAFAVGEANVASDARFALEECRKWFSTGVTIHVIVPIVLIGVGYPVGEWAISTGAIGVPANRISSCIWLWRFVCISTFVTMVNVPFGAMYAAKQYIAELTTYSFVQTILRTGFVYYMTLRPGEWLVKYGFVMCVIVVVPQLIICLRASFLFSECSFRWRYAFLGSYVKRLGAYAWWQMFGGLGYLAQRQFQTVIVNRMFGPRTTASFSISGTVGGEAAALTGALQTAFTPAITTACGEGNMDRVRKMAYQASKFGTLLTAMFAIPMALEINELILLWLKNAPPRVEGVCLIMLVMIVVEKLSLGHSIGINASGRVAKYQVCRGIACMTAVPLAIVSVLIWHHVFAVCFSLLASACIACCSDVWLARARIGLSVRYWVLRIVLPMVFVCCLAGIIGYLPHFVMRQSLLRMIITSMFSLGSLILLSWWVVLNDDERLFVTERVRRMYASVARLRRSGN